MFAMTTRVATPVVASAAPRASASRARASASRVSLNAPQPARLSVRARAEESSADAPADEDDFESRLGALRGKRSKRAAADPADKTDKTSDTPAPKAAPKGQRRKGVADFTIVGSIEEPAGVNWGKEEIVYEGPPARGEIIANVAMSWTLVWLPLTISAIGRGLWASEEIVDVIAIGRGVGLWGDMVITLKNQEKIELRSLPDFKKLEEHIRSRMGEADPEYAKI